MSETTATWLDRLVQAARHRVDHGGYDARPPGEASLAPIGSLAAAVQRAYPALVAEIKPGRPGQAPREVDVERLAAAYADGGACGISVLTDPDHFGGSLDNLARARVARLPLLMKDFIVDERQLDAAQAWGATAVLAIARLHGQDDGRVTLELDELVARAHERGLEVLAEVVTPHELDTALASGPDLIGVNARDLETLEMDPERTAKLMAGREVRPPVLHLSGIETASDVARALAAGAQGVLVGTSLMAAADPTAAVRSLLEVSA